MRFRGVRDLNDAAQLRHAVGFFPGAGNACRQTRVRPDQGIRTVEDLRPVGREIPGRCQRPNLRRRGDDRLPVVQVALAGRVVFFRWIKQHLRIKRFFGTSENAVKTQVWIAVATYVRLAIVEKRLGLKMSLHSMLQILSVTPFEKVPLLPMLAGEPDMPKPGDSDTRQTLLNATFIPVTGPPPLAPADTMLLPPPPDPPHPVNPNRPTKPEMRKNSLRGWDTCLSSTIGKPTQENGSGHRGTDDRRRTAPVDQHGKLSEQVDAIQTRKGGCFLAFNG